MDSGEVSFMITDTEPLNDGPVIDNSLPAPTGLNTEEELYQLDCRTGEAVVVSSARGPQAWHERSFEPSNCDVEEADEQSSRNHLTEESYEEEGAHDFTCEEGMDTVDSGCSSQSEMGDEERGCVEMEAGKEKYYCKYCDTTWPFGHFRNAQQFGAHCSNCSRRRKVKEPQELTLRERNTRSRKAKRPTHSGKRRRHPKVSTDHDDAMLLCAASDGGGDSLSSNNISSEEDFEASGISFLQQAALTSGNEASKTRKSSRTKGRKGKRKLDEVAPKMEEGNNDPFAIPFVRMPSRVSSRNSTLASQGASKKPKRDSSAKKKKSSSSKSKKSPVATEVEPEQAAIIADSNSLGGLLEAIERKLTAETKKKESTALKQQVWEMRNEIGEQFDASVEDLRFRSVALLQDLRLDMVAKLEGLKIDLASELSFRETRRKKRLNEMRIQMNALNRILENGKKDRDNGLLVSTFGGKFDTALKQLEELKANLQKEFAAREQAMQQQFTEMRATCSLHLANIKQQMQEELNVKENRMQKELEDMKHKLHSVCSKIGAENSSYDPEPAASASSALSSLPEPENFTTTTTTTTTTTILTSPSLLPAGLRLGVLPSFVGLTTTMVGAGLSPSSATAPLKTKSKRASSAKKPIASATKQNGTASLAETDALAFGLAEIKSAIS